MIGNFVYVCECPGSLAKWDSIPVRVIPKTLKMLLDISLLNTHQYKVRIKGKVDQSKGRSCVRSDNSV